MVFVPRYYLYDKEFAFVVNLMLKNGYKRKNQT